MPNPPPFRLAFGARSESVMTKYFFRCSGSIRYTLPESG